MTSDQRSSVHVRSANPDDLEFILSLTPRLTDFDLPAWRNSDAIQASSDDLLRNALLTPPVGSAVLIASSASGERLGFIHLETEHEFFTAEPQGYVANLAVNGESEGKGIGKALMSAAETWTKVQGMQHLTLFVFAGNTGARTFYEKLGFAEDSLKLVKAV